MKKFLVLFSLLVVCFSASSLKAEPKTIRIAPPAPQFTDAERQAELAARRARVLASMKENSMMILLSGEPKNYAGDVDFLYRQENNLYYLTNLKQKDATLVLIKDAAGAQEILFLPKRNPSAEMWNGRTYSREEAAAVSGLKNLIDASETKDFLQAIRAKKPFASPDGTSNFSVVENIYLLLPEDENDGEGKAEFRREAEFAKTLSGYKIVNARDEKDGIFNRLRLVKSPLEIKLVQHAVDITIEAQERAMAAAGQAKREYEVQAEVEYTFRKRNADYWGYPSIVGCGVNATTLHYIESQGAVKAGDLLLMDVGAEYEHYSADVTRTFPVSGKFTTEQAEIYRAVYAAQEAAAKEIKPGATFEDAENAAIESLKKSLARLGLITAPDATYKVSINGEPTDLYQYQLWFPHGWGHWLGMNVHDVGDYETRFQAGMITTNEPGIYVRENALDEVPDTPENKRFLAKIRPAFERYKNIGVRIEDDMLVTKSGAEWMTQNLPRRLEDVEAFMAQASKEPIH